MINYPFLIFLPRMGQSKGTIGYKVDIPRAGLTFKGCVDSDWEVGVGDYCRLKVIVEIIR